MEAIQAEVAGQVAGSAGVREAVETEAAVREAVEREAEEREAVGTEAVGTEAVEMEAVETEAVEMVAVETVQADLGPAAEEAMALGLAESAEAVLLEGADMAEAEAMALAIAGWAV